MYNNKLYSYRWIHSYQNHRIFKNKGAIHKGREKHDK